MDDIVFFTNFKLPQHVELFRLFRDNSIYQPWVYYTASDKGRIWNKVGDAKILDKPHRTIKNKIIILGGYSDHFLDLHSSNKIIYLARKSTLDRNEILLLGKIDHIIAETQFDAFSLAYQAKYHNPRIKVSYLHPWTDTTRYSVSRYLEGLTETPNPEWMSKALAITTIKTKQFCHGSKANFCVEPYDLYEATQYLLIGKPILASRRFQELVKPGLNGYLADSLGEAITSINVLKNLKHARQLGLNGRMEMIAKLEPYRYLREFGKIINNETPNLAPYKFIRNFQDRKWIVQEKSLESGEIVKYPSEYHSSFQPIELEDFNEIIKFFSRQLFNDAYIFGFYFPDYDRHELAQARTLVNRLGDRGNKIHFCLEDPVPEDWDYIFNKLSVVSKDEGLKQVR